MTHQENQEATTYALHRVTYHIRNIGNVDITFKPTETHTSEQLANAHVRRLVNGPFYRRFRRFKRYANGIPLHPVVVESGGNA